MAGTVVGQPPRKRLKVDDDPFGAIGDYAGSFLIKSALELRGGFDTNPRRYRGAEGIAVLCDSAGIPRGLRVAAPRRRRRSARLVHRLRQHLSAADRRHHLLGAGRGRPAGFCRPYRRPARRQPRLPPDGAGPAARRHRQSRQSEHPGRPARYPVYTTLGGTVGVDQNFNRLQLSAGATADRTVYQASKLTDGTSSSNDDRNFNQFGGLGRVSYDLITGLKPFGEIVGNVREHDQQADRNGYLRNSSGGSVRAGTSFEFSRILTGELAVGWAARTYQDPRLMPLQGLLTSASLVWVATPLTTARFFATTSIDETTVPGVSGVLTNTYTVQVDHDFRRWLTAIGKFTWGTQDYQGDARYDRFYSVSGDLIYKLNRNIWLKGTLRRDWLDSSIVGNSTNSTVVMLGVRLQH